ncbi:MAG TPA: hypothetical protein VGB73_18210 [Pyrinomonadaceae bacterium]|jgi:hypothetical protein
MAEVNEKAGKRGDSASGAPGLTLSFLGMANIAVRLVNQKYPGSQLYEGDGVSPMGPTTDVRQVSQWRFVFRTADGGTAMIRSRTWGEFYPVEYYSSPWLEDIVIPWPIKMDIVQADQLLKQAGYTQPYGAVTLRWPLYPGNEQPFYIFGMGGGMYVFVGVYDGSVSVPTTAQSAQKGSKKGSKK